MSHIKFDFYYGTHRFSIYRPIMVVGFVDSSRFVDSEAPDLLIISQIGFGWIWIFFSRL